MLLVFHSFLGETKAITLCHDQLWAKQDTYIYIYTSILPAEFRNTRVRDRKDMEERRDVVLWTCVLSKQLRNSGHGLLSAVCIYLSVAQG